jgi:hypothetical protein
VACCAFAFNTLHTLAAITAARCVFVVWPTLPAMERRCLAVDCDLCLQLTLWLSVAWLLRCHALWQTIKQVCHLCTFNDSCVILLLKERACWKVKAFTDSPALH